MKEHKEIIKEKLKQINILIGNNVRKARISVGISAAELSKRIGVTEPQISKYESGENAISPGRLVMIAETLKIDLLSLFNNTFSISNPQTTKVRNKLCINASRNFTEIKDINSQRYIQKIIKKTVDSQK